MTTEPAVGSPWLEARGQRVTSICPSVPAGCVFRPGQRGLTFLTTSMVIVDHIVQDTASGRRPVRLYRRVVVGLS